MLSLFWHNFDNCTDNLSHCRQSLNFSFVSWQLKTSHTITCLMSVSPIQEYFSAEILIKKFFLSSYTGILFGKNIPFFQPLQECFFGKKFDQNIQFLCRICAPKNICQQKVWSPYYFYSFTDHRSLNVSDYNTFSNVFK